MYADDITLYCSSSSLQDATLRLQAIVNKTAEWIDSNRLIINTSKSHSIIIGSKKKTTNSQLELFINGVKIEQISHCKRIPVNSSQRRYVTVRKLTRHSEPVTTIKYAHSEPITVFIINIFKLI